ncbi:hypothetical protein C1X94_13715 [Pseudomonas sp. FW306-02-H05-AB]|nr:hypothetical protein C1X94_13715 [Pseudomonas sp. FW306-02-H05-AB]
MGRCRGTHVDRPGRFTNRRRHRSHRWPVLHRPDAPPLIPHWHDQLWRGGLLPLGCEAALKPATALHLIQRMRRTCDCFAAEREQAPSPQGRRSALAPRWRITTHQHVRHVPSWCASKPRNRSNTTFSCLSPTRHSPC